MEQEEPAAILRTVRKTELRLEPLTGMEVADIFLKKRLLGKAQFVHLKAMEGNGSFRPYDLRAVPQDQAGPEHYIFSPSSVLHVQDGTGGVGFQTLGDWHREALQWNLLQGLPFFRNFRLRRAFTWWRGNVRRNLLRRARDLLQEQLLIAVPQFREALLQVSRLIEELKQVHWLPQDDSRSYTLQEFHSALVCGRTAAGRVRTSRSRWSGRSGTSRPGPVSRSTCSGPTGTACAGTCSGPRARQAPANMAALVDHMTVQSLATVARHEGAAFLRNVVTRSRLEQGGLFLTELVFGTEGQLAPVPPVHLLQEALQGALCSVADSVLQVIDSNLSSGSEDWVAEGTPLADAPQDLTPDPSPPGNNGVSGTTEPWGAKGELRNVMPRPVSPAKLVLPNAATPRVEGQRLRGHCYPLSRPALLWQLTASVGQQEAQGELARITQEAQQEVQQLCDGFSWLGEVQRSCSLWSSASLEAMRGWPSQRYREHIQRVQAWAGRLRSLPACFTTSNRLITVRCSHIREKIGCPQLASMEEEVLTLLQEEVQQRSEALVSQLKTAADWLRAEPTDLDGFSQYASRVKQCERQCADLQSQGQYLQSLRETLRLSSRSTRPDAVVLEAQVQDGWNQFLPLLQRAGEVVRQRSPSMADALDRTFSSLTQELQGLVSRATSGPYVDPTQESAAMVARLQTIHGQFCAVAAQLEQMKEASGVISNGEKPLDISFVTEGRQKLEDRKALWELLSVSASYIHEWRQLLFSKFVVLRAQEKVDRWLQQAVLLERTVPPCDMVLKHVLQLLEGFRQQLPLLAELSSPTLRRKHWGNIFKGQRCARRRGRRRTWSRPSGSFSGAGRRRPFAWLTSSWSCGRKRKRTRSPRAGGDPRRRGAKRRPAARRSRDSGTFIVIGLEALLSQTQASITTLSSMLPSPHAVELRREVERWVQQLQELEELLDIWKRYQLKWTYLSKMFHEFGVITQKPELYQRFLPVDGTYREMIETVSRDPRVLNFAQLGHGHPGLRALLAEGLTAMEEISAELLHLLEEPRGQFPRLRFLSDGEVTELLSLHPEPSGLLPLVRKCFQGVQELDVAYGVQESPDEEEDLPSAQPWVRGVFGGLGERLPFLCPVGPSLDPLAWLRQLEQQLHRAMVQLMADCAVARQRCRGEQGGKDLHRDQCLLVAEEALWCEEVRRAFRSLAPAKRALLKAHYDAKLQSLCQLVRDVSVGRSERSSGSRRAAAALRAMTLLSIKHSRQLSGLAALECELESSFEWQRLMKYHLSVDDHGGPGLGSTGAPADGDSTGVSCYVDVLSSRLPYGYELLSPECWTMVHTASSDRAALGIILALACYRCGFVGGPSTSGKTDTAVHLGQALGRHVVTLRCCPETSAAVVLQMLTGALQTGAWLLLDSADSMSQGALSLLGQHLSDIHHGFSFLLGRDQQQPGKCETEHEQTATAMAQDSSKGSIEPVELQVTLGGRTVSSKLGYGCVLLSSSRRAIEVPENLRIATRPVSLLQPDYGVIAEATLAASGFSEAASMSRRLVSLLSLAKDLACLPESSCAGPTSWLVLLTRVLTFAGIHLNQSMRVEWEKDKVLEGDQEAQRQLLHLVLRAPEGLGDGAKGARPAKSRRANQCVIVLQAIAEEQAVIKAVTLAVASAIVDPGKASHFHAIFEEMFPGARCPPHRLQGREEKQQEALKAAVVEELQDAGLQPSPSALSTALALYRALKLSRAVVLLGRAGSGKTTCYRALAGALRRLAGQAAEEDGPCGGPPEAGEGTGTGAPSPAPAWSSVDTAVVFPNALTTEELWGGFSGPRGCWRDGAITKALRESQELSNTESPTTESSVSHPPRGAGGRVGGHAREVAGAGRGAAGPARLAGALLHPLRPQGPLPEPPHGGTAAAAMGTRGAEGAGGGDGPGGRVPAAVARAAAWDPGLDPRCLRVWSRLADDLFAKTLSFLGERRLAPVLPEPGAGPREVTHGVQEVMSFSRVLCALKEQFGSNRLKAASKHTDRGEGTPDTSQKAPSDPATPSAQQELQARNVFVVAYVWGFGATCIPDTGRILTSLPAVPCTRAATGWRCPRRPPCLSTSCT
ncbi:hypothetical protein ANANG_G00240630 [Anguilla anguilla]|uniref:Dynein heavy chain domain-containing protein 1 n=1 Tax=Anguilla anguilla TaxID=7936 RepID=A0A9D3LV46_ANGAN|nr:hypothetical protein ANANG_G00240630 [Anguilla anguilla]